jgi:thiamine kinase-like enzyme
VDETRAQSLALVHGDYSPKNVLVYAERLVLLDHEVIHWGDPCFDLGFSFTHLLSKAHHVATHRQAFVDAAQFYWQVYVDSVDHLVSLDGFEPRAVRHTLACLLARVDGRSPLEYLTLDEKDRQRRLVLALMTDPPNTLPDLIHAFHQGL